MRDFFDQLRAYAADTDSFAALEGLEDYVRGRLGVRGTSENRLRTQLREIYLHRASLVRARTRLRLGTGAEDNEQIQARITLAVLELIDEVERLSSDAPRPLNPGIVGTVAAEANLERVWGLNTLKSLSWLRQALIAAKAVCRIETRTSCGTGFLVKADWVVTNHHVLANSSEVAEATLAFGFEEADDGSLGKPITYRLDPSTYIGDPDLDCAVARVAGRTDSLEMERTWGELKIDATTKLQTGQHVVIIQHPQGGPKRICMTDNQIVNVYGYRLQYMTDTMPGSSGSPVFSDDWSVVAVHHAGGNLQKNQKGEKLFANEGILFSAIAEHPSFRVVFETIE